MFRTLVFNKLSLPVQLSRSILKAREPEEHQEGTYFPWSGSGLETGKRESFKEKVGNGNFEGE